MLYLTYARSHLLICSLTIVVTALDSIHPPLISG
jgi:hypothetical protein